MFLLVPLAGALGWGVHLWRTISAERLVDQARAALEQNEPALALELALEASRRAPRSARPLVTAGEASARLGRIDDAVAYYDRITDDGSLDAIVGIGAAGDLLVQQGHLAAAEERFRRLLELDPRHPVGHRRLAAVLVASGRRRESIPHLFELVRQYEFDVDELGLFGNVEQIFEAEEYSGHFLKHDADAPLPLLGAARSAMSRHDPVEARALLERVVASAPDLLEGWVQLGRVLLETGSDEEFIRWHGKLPSNADDNPDIWAARGAWARKQGDAEGALRCYWEAVRRDPNHWQANSELAQLLRGQGRREQAAIFHERAERLTEFIDAIRWVLLDGHRTDMILKAAQLAEALQRPWEAWAWYDVLAHAGPEHRALARQERDRLKRLLAGNPPQTLPEANPARRVDLSGYPLPRLGAPRRSGRPRAALLAGASRAQIRFSNEAASAGLEFQYLNAETPPDRALRTWQSFGGGVAVVDFDGDGWPDLYFTQGGGTPPPYAGPDDPAPAAPEPNRLFRNLGDGRYRDVTPWAGTADVGYGQGVTVGDFDGDGFPDLYVANLGRNRLYRNNGDGTFHDVTDEAGVTGEFWTSSCLMADLTGNGLPDLYDVNYLPLRDVYERICYEGVNNEPRSCAPTEFSAEQDRIYVNRGDGTFEEATASAGIVAPDGKGLGILAADFDGSGRLSLFVANDTTGNFLFLNQTLHPGAPPAFLDQAAISGCAFDSNGRGQACMGIAADDFNGDGLFDLYITNFYHEYNVLYTQQPGGLFVNGTSEARLKAPSVMMLGFGTQPIDAALDGWPDLVVANGHVDDHLHKDIPFHMPPQFYANQGDGTFAELPAAELGDYFQGEFLGRALARLDWNRDGREDFVVTHLDAPAALVTNRTEGAGRFLSVRLRGVASNRDAIGAVVSVKTRDRVRVRQLMAGDGYYCSNERQLVFGLADADRVDEVHVRWPSGREQSFSDLAVDQEILLVEGAPAPYRLPKY